MPNPPTKYWQFGRDHPGDVCQQWYRINNWTVIYSNNNRQNDVYYWVRTLNCACAVKWKEASEQGEAVCQILDIVLWELQYFRMWLSFCKQLAAPLGSPPTSGCHCLNHITRPHQHSGWTWDTSSQRSVKNIIYMCVSWKCGLYTVDTR